MKSTNQTVRATDTNLLRSEKGTGFGTHRRFRVFPSTVLLLHLTREKNPALPGHSSSWWGTLDLRTFLPSHCCVPRPS
jgi:hypothetical protein